MHEHERRLERIRSVEAPRRQATMAIPAASLAGAGPVRSGDLVVGMEGLVAGFPGRDGGPPIPIVRVRRLEARRGERIGIVGPNGAGKTTLLRTVAGDLAPVDGYVRVGANVQPGYLAQIRGRALPGTTVLEALLAATRVDVGPARSYLARFLFRGEDVLKPVSELSGGERSRLELALLGISPANLLLLDEPTNHLDIPAREALEAFLDESPATLLIVSHDRRLLERVCERLWVVAPGTAGEPAEVAPFDAGYREWRVAAGEGWTVAGELERRAAASWSVRATGAPRAGARPATGGTAGASPASRPRAPKGAGRAAPLSKDAYRRQLAAVEADLTRLGLRKSQLELALGDPRVQSNFVELRRLGSELADVDAALGKAEDQWLALEERAPR
jgi:ATP-binding cassette subfamily F protein 3